MKPRSVAILAAVFVGLLLLVIIDRGDASASASVSVSLLPVRPSQISRISVTEGDRSVTLSRTGADWLVSSNGDQWPADPRRTGSGLRLLASAVLRTSDAAEFEPARSAQIEHAEGETMIDFAPGALSGTRPARLNDLPVRVDEPVAELLAPASLLQWRSRSVLPGLDGGVRSIRVSTPESTYELARSGTTWGLTRPVRTPADPERVAALIGALSALTYETWAESAELRPTTVSVSAESGAASWSLRLDDRSVIHADVTRTNDGTADLQLAARGAVSPESLAAIPATPDSLIGKRVLAMPSSDVQAIRFAMAVDGPPYAERTGRGWSTDGPSIDQLLSLLTTRDADSVEVDSSLPPSSAFPIRITRFGDLPAPTLWAWTTDEQLRIGDDGQVIRGFDLSDGDTSTLAAWLSQRSGAGD